MLVSSNFQTLINFTSNLKMGQLIEGIQKITTWKNWLSPCYYEQHTRPINVPIPIWLWNNQFKNKFMNSMLLELTTVHIDTEGTWHETLAIKGSTNLVSANIFSHIAATVWPILIIRSVPCWKPCRTINWSKLQFQPWLLGEDGVQIWIHKLYNYFIFWQLWHLWREPHNTWQGDIYFTCSKLRAQIQQIYTQKLPDKPKINLLIKT